MAIMFGKSSFPWWALTCLLFSASASAQKDFADCVYYDSLDVPMAIFDDETTTTISELTIAESFVITDLNVRVDITHPWIDDINIVLESPEGTLVELSSDNGGDFNNYTGTVLDDEGDTFITAGTPPFTGCFIPEELLAAFDGENAQGTWKLRVFDDFITESGTLDDWQLQFDCACSALPEGEYPSEDVPLDIPDDLINSAVSTLTIPDSKVISDVNVKLRIEHTFDQDLDVTLESPNGTVIQLFSGVGGGGNNFTSTVLDDEAGTAITAGTAPFTGSFRPMGLLSDFDGENAQGMWTLTILDVELGDFGSLLSWSLTITTPAPEISASPLSWDFGYRSFDAGPSASKNFVITNEGTADLHISGSTLVGGDAGQFTIVSGGGAQTVAALGTHVVEVAFDPSTVGSKAVILRISSDDADEAAVDVTLSGTGYDPAVGVAPEVWVDFDHVGAEDGTEALPFNTLSEGVDLVEAGGDIRISAGANNETGSITKAMTLHASSGTVSVGSS